MRYAVISDIHSNLEALEAVLAGIDGRGITTIYCLGDIVGYGPDPEACTDLVRARCARTVRGNHDEALFGNAQRFNPFARAAIRWTRRRMQPGLFKARNAVERWSFLETLPLSFTEGNALFVHGSPRDPTNEYIYQEDIWFTAETKLREIFSRFDRVLFVGHTHLPGIISDGLRGFTPKGTTSHFHLAEGRYIVNVGSVGQPRDRDNRACWVEVEDDEIHHHRVAYDFQKTIEKIRQIGELDEILGTRLADGM